MLTHRYKTLLWEQQSKADMRQEPLYWQQVFLSNFTIFKQFLITGCELGLRYTETKKYKWLQDLEAKNKTFISIVFQ